MASSIESRVPFLTPALAEFAAGMPDDYLIAPDGTGKLVLKRSLQGLVPAPILDRRDKIGFATPGGDLATHDGALDRRGFASDAARHAGPLRVPEARKCWQEMRDNGRQFDPMAWRWLNLIRWVDRFAVELDERVRRALVLVRNTVSHDSRVLRGGRGSCEIWASTCSWQESSRNRNEKQRSISTASRSCGCSGRCSS